MATTDNDTFCNQSITSHFQPILIVFCSSGLICAFTCAAVIAVMFIIKVFHSLTHRLILYMLIGILFFSLTVVFQALGLWLNFWKGTNEYVCIIESFLLEYSVWVMFLSTLMMTLHLISLVLFPSCYENISKLEPFYVIFPWVFPAVISWIPFIHNNYGVSGPWCWIRLYNKDCTINKEGIIEIYAVWYGDLTIGLIFNNVALIIIAITLCRHSCRSSTALDYRKALKQTLPLIFYPITYQILSSFGIANRIYESFSGGKSPAWMSYLHAATAPSWGLFAPIFTLLYFSILKKCWNVKGILRHCFNRRRNVMASSSAVVINDCVTRKLIDPADHLTQYGTTVVYPTECTFRTESEEDQEYEKTMSTAVVSI